VAEGTQQLADKVNGVAADIRPFLKDNGKSIGDTARLVSDSSKTVRDNLDVLVKAAPTAATAARTASDDLAEIYRTSCTQEPVPDSTVCPPLKRAKTAAADVADVADDVNALVTNQNGDLKKLRTQLTTLQRQADDLAERAPHLDEDLESAVKKVNALNTGAHKVSKGADDLHTGLVTARTGSADLDSGVGDLKKGSATARPPSPRDSTTASARSPTTTRRTATPGPESWPTRYSWPPSRCTRPPTTAPVSRPTSSRSPSGSARWWPTC